MAIKCTICGGPHNNTGHYAEANNVRKIPCVTKPVTKSLLKEAVIIKPTKYPVTKPLLKAKVNKDRTYSWREKNRAKYNEYQRELMMERKRGDKYESEEEGT